MRIFKCMCWLMGLGMTLLFLQGCRYLAGTHRAFSRSESKQHFYRNQSGFQTLVTDWIAHHSNDDIAYRPWNKDEIRWNGTSILLDGSGYLVQNGAHKGTRSDSFSSAAQLADAEPVDLANWVSSLKKLNVASLNVIGTKLPISQRYVQIDLQESGADYGYLYVPTGHEEAQAQIIAASSKQPNLIGMDRVEQIAPEWFYFEGKGAL